MQCIPLKTNAIIYDVFAVLWTGHNLHQLNKQHIEVRLFTMTRILLCKLYPSRPNAQKALDFMAIPPLVTVQSHQSVGYLPCLNWQDKLFECSAYKIAHQAKICVKDRVRRKKLPVIY